jgi:tetratricopeptide (TPR) repeat protein
MASRLVLALSVVLIGIGDVPVLEEWSGWLFGRDASEAGRRGNTFFQQQNYDSAVDAYRRGLQDLGAASDSGAVFAALQNNLGAALHRQKSFAEARAAFDAAHRAAESPREQVRALYNAGNAAAGMGELEAALHYYRRVLLQTPTHAPARFNYEFLKRQMQKRQEQTGGGSPPDVEPSAYARQLKQRADALVSRQQYEDALALMNDGLAQDSTVRAYQRFIRRLEDVTTILRGGGGPGAATVDG